jgi:uncharacterized protein (DUF952 family)
MRWLYHLVREPDRPAEGQPYRPPSLTTEGFVHCSYRDAVIESARLYFPGERPVILRIDPRLLDVPVVCAETPRGPMPHIHGAIPSEAVREVLTLEDVAVAPDLLD